MTDKSMGEIMEDYIEQIEDVIIKEKSDEKESGKMSKM